MLQELPANSADGLRLQKLLPRLERSDNQDRAQLETLRLRLLSQARHFEDDAMLERCRLLAGATTDDLLSGLLTGLTQQCARPDRQRDALTGLPPRVCLAERFEVIQLLARHHHSPFCLALILNPALSQCQTETGRALAGERLKSQLRLLVTRLPETASVCRWQQNGFLILLPNLSVEDARQRLEHFMYSTSPAWHGSLLPVQPAQAFASCVLAAWQMADSSRQGLLSPKARAPHIVIVDDDPLLIELLVYLFQKEGWRATGFPDGEQVLELLTHEPVDLLILDIMMPGFDGFELLSRIRALARFDALPIVMLSALRHEHSLARGFELGADDYLYKPFAPEELLIRLRHLLALTGAGG